MSSAIAFVGPSVPNHQCQKNIMNKTKDAEQQTRDRKNVPRQTPHKLYKEKINSKISSVDVQIIPLEIQMFQVYSPFVPSNVHDGHFLKTLPKPRALTRARATRPSGLEGSSWELSAASSRWEFSPKYTET